MLMPDYHTEQNRQFLTDIVCNHCKARAPMGGGKVKHVEGCLLAPGGGYEGTLRSPKVCPDKERLIDEDIPLGHEKLNEQIAAGQLLAVDEPSVADLQAQITRLLSLIDTPHTNDFMAAVPLEAAHQIKRWAIEHDEGKTPLDWFWLVGYLAQKAATSAMAGDVEKAKHHTISTAAVMNWYRRLTGDDQSFQPGSHDAIEAAQSL